jgi:hypothetical protein
MTSNQYRLVGVTLYVGTGAGTPPSVHESTVVPVVGTVDAAPLPQNCALLIRKRTSLAGRRGRGRFYAPATSEDQVTPTGIIAPFLVQLHQDAWSAFYNSLIAPQSGPPNIPVILHRSEGIGVEPTPTGITQFVVDGRIATQRRRLRP